MNHSLFKRAVADTDEPTPGYMFREMAQWTFVDYATLMKFVDALFEKLKPNTSVRVLQKVLRIIKIMCEMGHNEFQKTMQKSDRMDVIKAFISYRGVHDTKHGDSLNENVRKAAREAMEMIFTPCREDKPSTPAGYGNNGVTPTPSSVSSSMFASGTFSGGPVSLYGNNIAPMPATNKWAEHMAQRATTAQTSTTTRVLSLLAEKAKNKLGIASTLGVSKEKFKSARGQLYENVLKLSTAGVTSSSVSTTNAGGFQPVELNNVMPCVATAGSSNGGWKFVDEVKREEEEDGSDSDFALKPQPQETQQRLTPFQDVVQRLCQLKNTPQRVELAAFVAQCCRLGAEMIQERGAQDDEDDMEGVWEELAEALDAQLAPKCPWQRRLNALVAVEALLSSHLDDAGEAAAMRRGIMRYFLENPEDVQRNILVVQATLRERAQRVAKLLGLAEANVSENQSGDHAPDFSSPAGDVSLQSRRNLTSTFSLWSPPSSSAPATAGGSDVVDSSTTNMGGVSLRANRRGVRDKTTLRKRAPMRVTEEPSTYTTDGENRCHNTLDCTNNNSKEDSFFDFVAASLNPSKGSNNNNRGTAKEGHGDFLDELFGGSSMVSSRVTSPPAVVLEAPISSQVGTSATPLSSQNDDTTAFRFLTTETVSSFVPPAMAPHASSSSQLQDLFVTPCPAPSSAQELLPLWGNPTSHAEKSGSDTKDNNGTAMGKSSAVVSSPTTMKSLPLLLQDIQQQLQTLMTNTTRDPDTNTLAQLQLLMAQQQKLMTLVSQRQEEQQLREVWSLPSSEGVCDSNVGAFSSHRHFALGAGSSGSVASSLVVSNAFAEMQQEMMTRLAASKPQQ